MGYGSKGRRPIERASKIAHTQIIKNTEVQNYIKNCIIPNPPDSQSLENMLCNFPDTNTSDITAVIAVDGGYTETYVRNEYPSASIAFFTFGPLLFQLADLRALDDKKFIAPDDLARLKQIERYTLVLPTKGIRRKDQNSLKSTVRRTIFEFFDAKREDKSLMTSLRWFLFRRWQRTPDNNLKEILAHCPNDCGYKDLVFTFNDPGEKPCPQCTKPVYLTDTFRLHERIDEELGASGITAYVMTMLEQLVLVHLFYDILALKPSLMRNILFIKDGPLAFFGLVAPLYKPMRELISYLLSEPDGNAGPTLQLVGLEKSGAFVEHAESIQDKMTPGSYLLLNDDYIRQYIVPGDATAIYGANTYYGQKIIYRAKNGDTYVATIPGKIYTQNPKPTDIPHLHQILSLVAELRCSMYDNALIPVALANKLVSLSDYPSQRILGQFVKSGMHR